jgi:glycosyltransferase involved in cell wall biosynthesis
MSSIVLSPTPLTDAVRARLAEDVADREIRWVNLSRLRHSPWAAWRSELLRGVDAVYLVAESSQQRATVSILMSVAAIIPARRRYQWNPEGGLTAVSRAGAMAPAASIAAASAMALGTLAAARLDLSRLRRAPRVVTRPAGKHMLYLKTMLNPGVIAGGSVGHIAGVAGGFVERGYDVLFASVDRHPNLPAAIRSFPLEPLSVYSYPPDLNNYRFSRSCTRQLSAAPQLRDVDVIYQRMTTGNYAGVELSRARRIPLVLEYNGSEAWIARNWGKALAFERAALDCEDVCLRHAHLVVTVSDVLRDELVSRGVSPRDIVTYPNCIDEALFDPGRFSAAAIAGFRRSSHIPLDKRVVCFVGTFGKWHGAEVLAAAAKKIITGRGDGLHFVFVGDGLTMPEVRATLAGCERAVTFTGVIAQHLAPLALASSDILVAPHRPNEDGSRFIGSPTKLFEYMAMGKPIVASRLDQIGEVLAPSVDARGLAGASAEARAESHAVMTEPGSVDDLVTAILALADDAELARTIGANARERALGRYTWRHHVAAIAERLQP